jgi:hypothetical protein
MGWFFPSALGEPLMSQVVDPLLGSFMPTRRRDAQPPTADDFARYDAYDKACARAAAWDLQLRFEDGSLVPTESVGIRDVEALLACCPDDEENWEDEIEESFDFFDDDPSDSWKRDSEKHEAEAELRRDIEHDLKLIDQWMEEKAETHQRAPEDDEPLPRYQIIVLLPDPSALP